MRGSARSPPAGRPPVRRIRARSGRARRARPLRRGSRRIAAARRSGRRGRHAEPAVRRLDDVRGLALGVDGGDHGPSDRKDPVETARHDIAGQSRRKTDHVDVGARKRLREPLAGLVGKKADVVERRGAPPGASPRRASRRTRRSAPRDRRDRAGGPRPCTSVSRSCAWPTLPECMTTNFPASPFSRAQSFSFGLGSSSDTSTQFGITRIRSGGAPFASSRIRIVSPIATTRSARRR